MKIGEILVRKGLLAQSQLDPIIITQASTRQKLGKLLVDYGIDHDTLEQALAEQNWRSHGFGVID